MLSLQRKNFNCQLNTSNLSLMPISSTSGTKSLQTRRLILEAHLLSCKYTKVLTVTVLIKLAEAGGVGEI